ncbi:MAG: endolytic transglycosylase MltG [Proteobacteria bacterium]|nr:endolytic transglycosylase MltG [Candidatus Enterousia scatequi]
MVRKLKSWLKKYRVGITLLLVIVAVIVCLGMFAGPKKSNHVVSVNVASGASVSAVANNLKKRGVIDSVSSFKIAVQANGGRIQAGIYDIPRGASAWRIATMLANGDVAKTTIVIPEGLTIKQIKQLLSDSVELNGSVNCDSGNNAPVCNLHDGDVFPDTYRVARGTSRLAVLDLARKKMVDVHNDFENKIRRMPSPLKNWNDVLTLASIVQKETPRVKEMPIVASVYLNRLNSGMRLQADPTVVYALTNGLGDMQGAPLLSGHLHIDSPYNTYRNSGLPPAPIANVGRDAIYAVLNPARTKFLFFVADGHGGHNFAKTYEEHVKNHEAWRKIKKSRK